MYKLVDHIATGKAELDRLRPLSGGALAQLQKYYDVELTYTSNAIEGNPQCSPGHLDRLLAPRVGCARR